MTTVDMPRVEELHIFALGRPAPQGSKHFGAHGQLREASAYLPAWSAAIKQATYIAYLNAGIAPDDLPLFRGAVEIGVTFWMPPDMAPDEPPDIDKLLRAVLDVLGKPPARRPRESDAAYAHRCRGRGARVWEDDCRITGVLWLHEEQCPAGASPGADIYVRPRSSAKEPRREYVSRG